MKPVLFIIMVLVASRGISQKKVIICKTQIDGTGKTISNHAIIIEGDKIIGIIKKDDVPRGSSIIDLGDYTMLPGLIDLHVHPDLTNGDYQVDRLRAPSALKALMGLKNVQDLLAAGWTTLRVAGEGAEFIISLPV